MGKYYPTRYVPWTGTLSGQCLFTDEHSHHVNNLNQSESEKNQFGPIMTDSKLPECAWHCGWH